MLCTRTCKSNLLVVTLAISFCQFNPGVRVCVDDLFCGSYSYVTKCEGCEAVSAVDSQFYELELNVQDCPNLTNSLDQFFKVYTYSMNKVQASSYRWN